MCSVNILVKVSIIIFCEGKTNGELLQKGGNLAT